MIDGYKYSDSRLLAVITAFDIHLSPFNTASTYIFGPYLRRRRDHYPIFLLYSRWRWRFALQDKIFTRRYLGQGRLFAVGLGLPFARRYCLDEQQYFVTMPLSGDRRISCCHFPCFSSPNDCCLYYVQYTVSFHLICLLNASFPVCGLCRYKLANGVYRVCTV